MKKVGKQISHDEDASRREHDRGMGVRGLSSYVTGCQRACSEHVELHFDAADGESGSADRKGPVRLAVDGLALVYHVMQNAGEHNLHLDLGCDYGSLHDALVDYLSALLNAGVRLLVIVDGMQDLEKESTTLERRRSQAADASAMMSLLPQKEQHEGRNKKRDSSSSAPSFRQASLSLLPLFAAETLAAACRFAGVPLRPADREADPELAAACRRPPLGQDWEGEDGDVHRRAGRGPHHHSRESRCCAPGVGVPEAACDAVLSNDSDFLVMDIPGYIPFWSLGVGADRSAGALVFRRASVAARLGIPADWMPYLACLVGNDWIQPDRRVHRAVMEAVATGRVNTTKSVKKQRKGKTSKRSGGGAKTTSTAARPGGSRGGGTGSSCLDASAKNMVEATGRYLSEFLREQKDLPLAPADRGGVFIGSPDRGARSAAVLGGDGHGAVEGVRLSWPARQLCGSFFPTLLQSGDATGEEPRHERPQLTLEHLPQWQNGDDPVTTTSTSARTTKSIDEDSPKQQQQQRRRRRRRSNGGPGKGWNKVSSRSGGGNGNHRDGQGPATGEGVGAGDGGGGGGGAKEVFAEAEQGVREGEAFLSQFQKARLHYEVFPAPVAGVEEAAADESSTTPTIACAESTRRAPSSSGLLLSKAGLRAGICAPPELAQAVLEGVFWCRVMFEDSSVLEETTPRFAGDCAMGSSKGGIAELAASPVLDGRARATYSSAFASLSDVRKGLYELCLAQLLDSQTIDRRSSSTDHPAVVASSEKTKPSHLPTVGEFGSSDGCGRPDVRAFEEAARVSANISPPPTAEAAAASPTAAAVASSPAHHPPGVSSLLSAGECADKLDGEEEANQKLGTIVLDSRSRIEDDMNRPGSGGCTDRSRSLKKGDEWVVREFRRSGASVRAVNVVCRVPAPVRLNSGSSLVSRWNRCLAILGLTRRDNRLLEALMKSEELSQAGRRGNSDCAVSRERPGRGTEKIRLNTGVTASIGLTAVALVATKILSASDRAAYPQTSRPNSQRSASDAPHVRDVGGGRSNSCHSHGWEPDKLPIEEAVVTAFVAAVTRYCHSCRVAPDIHSPRHAATGSCGLGVSVGERVAFCGVNASRKSRVASPGVTSRRRVDVLPEVQAHQLPPVEHVRDCFLCGARYEGKEGSGVGRRDGVGEDMSEDTSLDGDRRCFVNLWSKVQSVAWHVNACLAALELSTPSTRVDKNTTGYVLPIDPLSLRPGLALNIFSGRDQVCDRWRHRRERHSPAMVGRAAPLERSADLQRTSKESYPRRLWQDHQHQYQDQCQQRQRQQHHKEDANDANEVQCLGRPASRWARPFHEHRLDKLETPCSPGRNRQGAKAGLCVSGSSSKSPKNAQAGEVPLVTDLSMASSPSSLQSACRSPPTTANACLASTAGASLKHAPSTAPRVSSSGINEWDAPEEIAERDWRWRRRDMPAHCSSRQPGCCGDRDQPTVESGCAWASRVRKVLDAAGLMFSF